MIVIAIESIENKLAAEQACLAKLLSLKQGLMQDLLTHKVAVDKLICENPRNLRIEKEKK
jgi:hypothetical protein